MGNFLNLTTTDAVRAARAHYYGASRPVAAAPAGRDELGPDETAFIASRDSFYLATVGANGWPYLQHRGGEPGFLHATTANTLAFADYTGNRQLLSTGNLATNDRVTLFLMDYPRRTRLKLLGHARVVDARAEPELVAQFAAANVRRLVERIVFVDVVAFDWNCPKHITPRYTAAEIEELVTPLRERIVELERQLQASRPS